MRKLILLSIICLTTNLLRGQNFDTTCITTINVRGLTKTLSNELKANKEYFIYRLNDIVRTNPGAPNICQMTFDISYENGKGIFTINAYYNVYAFWNNIQPKYSNMVNLMLPYTVAATGTDYLRRIAMLTNEADLASFEVRVKLKKDKSKDYLLFKTYSTPSSRGFVDISFSEISVFYLGKKYYADGRTEMHMFYPGKTQNLSGEKNGTYYFFKFCETN